MRWMHLPSLSSIAFIAAHSSDYRWFHPGGRHDAVCLVNFSLNYRPQMRSPVFLSLQHAVSERRKSSRSW
jgi:hypothetical protein